VTKFVTLPVGREKLTFGSPAASAFSFPSVPQTWTDDAMRLKHLNLTTSDVSGLAGFFERFFGFKRLLERGSGAFALLRNDENSS
jgi:hypothetical protein